ncbi:MAG TPA: MSMEG_0565 family glycosyltransferase [Jatrophihabitantaceae bacterium]
MSPRVALVTYSTKPRGGVVHTLSLADALLACGMSVPVIALGDRFFRDVRAPQRLVPAPPRADTLEQRVADSVDALERGLTAFADDFDILHTQDCISARAAARVRDAGAPISVVRTVHHVDDFTTQALIDCQRQSIVEPDRLIVPSKDWRRRLHDEFGVDTDVIYNGVDATRFGPIEPLRREALRRELGLADRFVFLSVGGVEPRKGTVYLFEALAALAADRGLLPRPALVIVGGHSFQDYQQYRDKALAMLDELGLELGRDVVQLGTITDRDLHDWYRSADALAFPSVKEGWGLAVLEAMSADLPVVASDIAVFREYLSDGTNAVLTTVGDPASLAEGLRAVMTDAGLRHRLVVGGRRVVPEFTWERAAREHARIYQSIRASRSALSARPDGAQ